ncbi:MAG: hypothetical protein IJ875_05875 [Solobacterium sp.]|nr:hypothetical protein [Solobacterium sp.]
MTRTLLANHCYLLLPLSLEKEEAHQLAYSFIEEVSQMMDDGKTFQEIKDKIQRMN